jgi:hypothetical protein
MPYPSHLRDALSQYKEDDANSDSYDVVDLCFII